MVLAPERLKENPITDAEQWQRQLHEQQGIPIPEAKRMAAQQASDTHAGYGIGINIDASTILKKMRRHF